ncbi:MAG: FKBP-type peptidyl-prolyl cis-trans isomerase [Cellvibrionales bacterium]|nr:FKBP-type peptidyl-prolyl cis-trans isomerase [Cellvibrionales bacterium]
MYKIIFALFASALLLAACAPPEDESAPALDSLESAVSYMVAYENIKNLGDSGFELDQAAFKAGAAAAFGGQESAIGEERAEQVMQEFQERMREQAMAEREQAETENLAASTAFLEANSTAEGVEVTDSGLQYRVLEEGSGAKPTTDSRVRVHYEGRLINGEVFDSSRQRGTPAEFGVTQVIAGWTEGLQLMAEGARYEFFIPSDLAYGPGGPPGIGPNQALIFDVELLDVDVSDDEPEAEEEGEE